MQPATPQTMGEYDIIRAIGRGGMGLVYEARHQTTGQRVAVKVARREAHAMSDAIRREIRALSRVPHTGVVRILSADFENHCWGAG